MKSTKNNFDYSRRDITLIALGLADVPNPTANAENDVEDVKGIILDLRADEELLGTSLKRVEKP